MRSFKNSSFRTIAPNRLPELAGVIVRISRVERKYNWLTIHVD
jgi:hypothetical protein